jgi:maleylpyruvate isomerase
VRTVVDVQVQKRLAVAAEATGRLLDSLEGIDDAWCRAASRLPGWTRGHVLTHLARNADGLVRLVTTTAEGHSAGLYGPGDAREAEIEAGAGRPSAELVDDVRDSAARLDTTCRAVPDQVWETVTEWRAGRRQPLRDVPVARVVEVEIHRVDLGAGYEPADWPDTSTKLLLAAALARLSGAPSPPLLRLEVDGEDAPRGSDDPDATVVSGPGHELVTWLTGRGDGAGLRCERQLPDLPAAWG